MTSSTGISRLTGVQWLICIVAAIGFAFDVYVLLMLPLIVKPALAALGGVGPDGLPLLVPGKPEYVQWARLLFFVPALAGGVFGLLGGWLTDRLGRRRVLTGSIVLYAISAFAAGFATSLPQLLFWRCLIFVGVCVEFVAAVAWLAELFTHPIQRERILGITQAFSSLGGLLVAIANKGAIVLAASLPAIHASHEAWRYTLMSGLIPAIPLLLIRPFLPESPEWQRKRDAGELKRPSFGELFQPALLRTTVISTLLFAASYGVAFGAIQHLPQILPGHADVKAVAKNAIEAFKAKIADAGKGAVDTKTAARVGAEATEDAVATVQLWQEIGGLMGRFALAFLALRFMSRRSLFRAFQIPSLILIPILFWLISKHLGDVGSLSWMKWLIFAAGFLVVGQLSFWGNYLPLVYPLHLRGTGESFSANIGGRVLGTSAAWLTFTFSAATPPSPSKIALTAAFVAGGFALLGALLTHWLPEPSKNPVA